MNARIVLEFPQAPEAKEIGIENFPQDLDAYAITPEQLDAIASVFDDEPSAEVLCELLTP